MVCLRTITLKNGKFGKEVFKNLLSAIPEDGWKIFDPTVYLVGGIIISKNSDVASLTEG